MYAGKLLCDCKRPMSGTLSTFLRYAICLTEFDLSPLLLLYCNYELIISMGAIQTRVVDSFRIGLVSEMVL